ncbi:hypothetical protein [Desulfolutivibrio sulfoxidireducens]|uniref:hypothetical protein n=1 Tax=Desulfolutivibrio sulfoxidireducens TaxID=2773299 RepID=UPI00159E1BAE|nr:hypothetical protein [Desulfolutivibrio sulfoxidireducens]QLA16143.1 hypothetical protein GD605_08385 [Desulfolutivibrio sulfoxidireducens]QLA19960.1 hypothetical protein GD604_09570 [Desulfolutivibrio sulfoxidireducens]
MDCDKTLKDLFDMCLWKSKTFGELPGDPGAIRYLWRAEDAGLAELFFRSGLLTEETSAIRRSLFLGREPGGSWALCVAERTREDFDPKEVGRGITALMDMGNVRAAFSRAKAE